VLSGRFGKPVEIVAVCGQHFPTYRPAYRETYYVDRATGGGAIQDALTHILNVGEWLVGPIERLVADAAHRVLAGVTVEDTVHVLTRHGDVLGSYSLNQHQAPNEVTMTVICERGTVRWETHAQRWRWMMHPDDLWHDEPHEPQPRDAMFVTQANRFLDAVEGRTSLPLSTHAQVKWHNRRSHNQRTNVPRSPGTRRAARRQSPDTVCGIDCYAPKLTNGCVVLNSARSRVSELASGMPQLAGTRTSSGFRPIVLAALRTGRFEKRSTNSATCRISGTTSRQ